MSNLLIAKLRLAKWAARSLTADEVEKANRWPAGAPGSKGGQFAPANGGAGGGKTGGKVGGYSYAGKGGPWQGEEGGGAGQFKPVSYPNAKAHPKRGDSGEPITIKEPTRASDPKEWGNPSKTATFTPGGAAPQSLNGVKMQKWHDAPNSISEWAKVPGQNPAIEAANPFVHNPEKRTGAGVIIQEPDGRVWLTTPTNAFGGYRQTLPKGGVEDGLNLQASAIKEAYEETGLQVRIVGVLGDYERSTSKARYYIAERVGGTPSDMGWESQALRLATRNDLKKLLNVAVDRNIMDDYFEEQEFFKQAPLKAGGGSWMKQERWPAGSPLGGQWKAMGADGLTIPPKVAGGLDGSNKVYQKGMNAAHAAAQSGDVKTAIDAAITWAKKSKALTDKGAKSSHVKWTAQVSQYLSQLSADLLAKHQAGAVAERLTGPLKVSGLKAVGAKPGGSNPGGMYEDGKGGKWLVKGNLNYTQGQTTGKVSDDRAKNEVLAAKLLQAAGVGAPDMKLTDLEGKHGGAASGQPGSLGVASRIIDGLASFNPNNAAHVAAAQADYAVHAWLGNWDVLGASWDNTMIDKDGKAVCIDTGGAILFRAQGSPKAAGQFSASADDWETMRGTDAKQKAVYGKMTASQLAESAAKLANVSDATIKELVKTSGLGDDLADTLIKRRDAILAKAGVTAAKGESGLTEAKPIDPPQPPKLSDEVKPAAPVDPVPGLKKPTFDTGLGSDAYYSDLSSKMEQAHAAGDIAALEALGIKQYGKNKGKTTWKTGTANGSKMAAYHGALMADLKAKQGEAITQVATGQATVTDKNGKEWAADKGVLNPVGEAGSKFKPHTQHQIKMPTGAMLLKPIGLKGDGSMMTTIASGYHSSGNVAALKNMLANYPVWKTGTPGHTKIKAYIEAAVKELEAKAPTATQADDRTAAQVAAAPAAAGKAIPKEKIGEIVVNSGFFSTSPDYVVAVKAAIAGDVQGVQEWAPESPEGAATKAAFLRAMGVSTPKVTPPAAPEPPASVPPAGPNFEAYKTTSAANPGHNPKVDAIAAAFAAGDVASILAMSYGTNTYGKKQAQLANDALAALGSPHKVELGQKKGAHPALIGGSVQPVPPSAAAGSFKAAVQPEPQAKAPKPKLSDMKVENLPSKPDLMNWKGPGNPYSSKAWKNEANIAALDAIQAAALQGGSAAVDALKFPELDPNTGAPTGKMLSALEHPSKKIITQYAADVKEAVEDFLHPPRPLGGYSSKTVKSIQEVAAGFLSVPISQTVASQPKDKKFGYWIALGKAGPVDGLVPKNSATMSEEEYQAGKTAYKGYSSLTKKYIQHVQSNGQINREIDKGSETYDGLNLKEVTKALYKDATPLKEGSTVYRWAHMPAGMLKQLEAADPGVVFQSQGGFCTSQSPTATSHFGNHRFVIRAAKGAKAIHSHGSGSFAGEKEITTLPGQRFMITGKTKKPDGNWEVELLMLPPQEGWPE